MKDIRDFFGAKPFVNEKKDSQKRTLVIQDSSDDEVVEEKIEAVPKSAPIITAKKSVDPSSFFSSKTVSQVKSNLVKESSKKLDKYNDYEFDEMELDDDIIQILDSKEEKVQPSVLSILTEKNTARIKDKNQTPQLDSKTSKSPSNPDVSLNQTPQKSSLNKKSPPKSKTPVKAKAPAKSQLGKSPENADGEEVAVPTKRAAEEETAEKKEPSAKQARYMQFIKKQSAPAAPKISRSPPIGSSDCFLGKTFVFTGELPSLSRSDAEDIVKRYGGKTPKAISKKTNYVVAGDEPGPSKIAKAKELNLKILDEDAFYDLVNSFSPSKVSESAAISPREPKKNDTTSVPKAPAQMSAATSVDKGKGSSMKAPESNELWTVKYRPKQYADVIGNTALVKKISCWLKDWDANKAKGFPKGSKDEYSHFRAVLLSGPPGIGKTTAAHLVAELEGFEAIEFNASDTRSKKSIENVVKEATLSRTVTDLFSGKKNSRKVVIMDEVDGMSAGDRGGSTELIKLIKNTSVPIICICNDHSSPKMRSLANSCLDLKFRRPSAAMVEKRVSLIAQKERLQIDANVIAQLVAATSADIRQIINVLSTYRLSSNHLTFDGSKNLTASASKNISMSPFDIIAKLLSASSFRSTTFSDKIDLYFQDYSLIPLFVQENYIKMDPMMTREAGLNGKAKIANQLKLLSEAADSISDSDLLETAQRNENSWSLLPLHAVLSSIRPCFFVHGNLVSTGSGFYGGGFSFPSWLGQYSKQAKGKRLLRELQMHMRLVTSADKDQVVLNYLPVLTNLLTDPLILRDVEGVDEVIQKMDSYYLNREDWDSMQELGFKKDINMSTKAKTTFTRTYNKTTHPTPFSGESMKVGKAFPEIPDCDDVMLDDITAESEGEEEELQQVQTKKGKAGSSKKGKTGSAKASSSKASSYKLKK